MRVFSHHRSVLKPAIGSAPMAGAFSMPAVRRYAGPERRSRDGAESLSISVARCDNGFLLRFFNRAFALRFGLHGDDAIGRGLSDLLAEQTFHALRPCLEKALQGEAQEQEIPLPLPEAGEHFLHLVAVPETDAEGEVRGIFIVLNDTTRLRRAEDQLCRRELEFKTLVENSPDVISRIDRGMRHLYVNPAIEAAFGIEASAYQGRTKEELGLPADMVKTWEAAAHAAFASGESRHFTHTFDTEEGVRHFSTRLIPEPDLAGNIDSLLAITYDVTSRTQMEAERDVLLTRERTARIQAETAARARDEFLAIVSHELRAPLNGIQSWAHVLESHVKEISPTPLVQRALQGIRTGVAQQVRLIEDLLDVTCMMSGKLRLVKQPFTVLPVIKAAVESVKATATARKISLSTSYRIAQEQIEGDSDRVQQIIWNLLSNAIKFTPEGGSVTLTAALSGAHVCIKVHDSGVGISPEFLPHLFDRFSQQDTSSTRGNSGLGLGLFLVRHLVELHGGRIHAESAGAGEGATFSVYLPLRSRIDQPPVLPANDEAAVALPSLEGLRILVIDDQEEARESLEMVLATAGVTVYAAASSQQALERLSQLEMEKMPDLLVCDIAMPGEDGYTALHRIRAWKNANGFAPLQRMPALALTAFSQREDRLRALTSGFQMHVAKPVAPEELIIVIANMAARG